MCCTSGTPHDPNAPVADAGRDRNYHIFDLVQLDGSGSAPSGANADSQGLRYQWIQNSGPPIPLTGANTATPHFEAPGTPGILTFQLRVSDGTSISLTDEVAITVLGYTGQRAPNNTFNSSLQLDTEGQAAHIATSGSYVYIADGEAGLAVVDVTNPYSPQKVGQADTAGSAVHVVIQGSFAYVADTTEGLAIVDIDNPEDPKLVQQIPTKGAAQYEDSAQHEGSAQHVVIQDGVAYIANGGSGLAIVDITDIENIPPPTHINLGDFAEHLVIRDHYAYLATGFGGFAIVNLQTLRPVAISYPLPPPEEDRETGDGNPGISIDETKQPSEGLALRVALQGGYAYVAYMGGGLEIIDIANPESPVFVKQVLTADSPRDIVLRGNFAYVADGWRGFTVIDITTPDTAEVIANIPNSTRATSNHIVIHQSSAYVASGVDGVLTVDISDPRNPSVVAQTNTTSSAENVAIADNRAYVANKKGGISIETVFPIGTSAIKRVPTDGSPRHIVLQGDYAYIADSLGGLAIIDIRDPLHAQNIGQINTDGEATFVAIDRDYAYVADGARRVERR